MILPFITQLNGKPTYFVEKICKGLIANNIVKWDNDIIKYSVWNYYLQSSIYFSKKTKPKIHTIREDKKDRWKSGTMIDFFINTRTKDMFRFAPRIPVVSTQKIEIVFITDAPYVYKAPEIHIDGKVFESSKWLELAQNDGFDTIEDFFAYFNEDFTGKIIHWTDKKY